jgi:hypothetical protein
VFYLKGLIKQPPQFKVTFIVNNRPVYDILPKAKEFLEKGPGRPTP